MVTASELVAEGLGALAYQTWPIPPSVQKRFLLALKTSPCSRVVTLRQQLALLGHTDLDAFFTRTATPQFMMALCDDLVSTRLLSRQEASVVQTAILTAVNKDGTWISYKDYEERTHPCPTSTNATKRLASIVWCASMMHQISKYVIALCSPWSK